MAQFKKSTIEFIQDSFSPTVALHCSHDAEIICAKKNLTFNELLQLFSRLNLDGLKFNLDLHAMMLINLSLS